MKYYGPTDGTKQKYESISILYLWKNVDIYLFSKSCYSRILVVQNNIGNNISHTDFSVNKLHLKWPIRWVWISLNLFTNCYVQLILILSGFVQKLLSLQYCHMTIDSSIGYTLAYITVMLFWTATHLIL